MTLLVSFMSVFEHGIIIVNKWLALEAKKTL